MTNNNHMVLDEIEPDLAQKISADAPSNLARYAGAAALFASAPLVLALTSSETFAAGALPKRIVNVLNFALTLEYFEDAFYKTGLGTNGLIPRRYHTVFRTISRHETEHVALLQHALGRAAVKAPRVDFTAGGKYADVFSNFKTFLTLSETFEDLGVAAYKGQAPHLQGNGAILTTALQIHSVEARHASEARRIGGKYGWTGAFDKPLTKAQVLRKVKPFLA